MPSPYDEIYMNFNSDGTVSAVENKNKELEDELNKFILFLKNGNCSPCGLHKKVHIQRQTHFIARVGGASR